MSAANILNSLTYVTYIVDMDTPRVFMKRDRERTCACTYMHTLQFVLRMEECTCDSLPNEAYVKSDLSQRVGLVDL